MAVPSLAVIPVTATPPTITLQVVTLLVAMVTAVVASILMPVCVSLLVLAPFLGMPVVVSPMLVSVVPVIPIARRIVVGEHNGGADQGRPVVVYPAVVGVGSEGQHQSSHECSSCTQADASVCRTGSFRSGHVCLRLLSDADQIRARPMNSR